MCNMVDCVSQFLLKIWGPAKKIKEHMDSVMPTKKASTFDFAQRHPDFVKEDIEQPCFQ